jgi:hypothetical protein
MENFAALLLRLRERAPHALFDERMVKARRAANRLTAAGPPNARSVAESNELVTDLCAYVLAMAHASGQL